MKESIPIKNLENQQPENFSIPLKYRKIENLHIVFWLIKDLCWCLVYKPLAVLMILPTLTVAFVICWQNRKSISDLCHNLAVTFWIIANTFWMISEFYKFDTKVLFLGMTGKNLAIIPFSIGILILVYYYGYYLFFNKLRRNS